MLTSVGWEKIQPSRGSVTLVAVSKTRSADEVRQCEPGARDFGENQVQEAVDKIRLRADIACPGISLAHPEQQMS
ncbi:MAG: hypothetical protein Ct9H300mP14_13730 [Gammaproteobacteria bacterium]|nr:MAG: hypothetical protein Ct9H300mP14_13730 [Gammaproteobacteria bacterium]